GGARAGARLARRLRGERPDLFHAHLSWPLAAKWATAAAVLAGRPTVATVHLVPEFRLARSSYWQLRALARGVDRYIAVSQALADELAGRFHWPREKIDVVYNAVRLERFGGAAPTFLRAELAGDEQRPVVFTCARLDAQKGLDVLLRAAAAVPEAVFAIAGEGPLGPSLEGLASELGVADRVRFLGFRRDIPELMAAADVFTLPSLYEGSPLAVLEAMAARRAIVSSAIGGTNEVIVDGESGLLVPPGDPEALAAALRRVLADPGLRESLAANARNRVEERFTPAAMVRSVEHVYEQLLAR
ncbi:MAG TPA: glycosyltransferase family 4 protein, partial [Solirubrobacterales bacterium]|nr:glycosyltransferase family 4 protein [Solirubrobacterales bacterium]